MNQAVKSELNSVIIKNCVSFFKDIINGPINCYTKFGMRPEDIEFTPEELEFRYVCLNEELSELKQAILDNNQGEVIDAIVDLLFFTVGTLYRMGEIDNFKLNAFSINNQEYILNNIGELVQYVELNMADKTITGLTKLLLSLASYLLFNYNLPDINEYYNRVTAANLAKEVGSNSKRGSFLIDLVKPENWKSPNFNNLYLF